MNTKHRMTRRTLLHLMALSSINILTNSCQRVFTTPPSDDSSVLNATPTHFITEVNFYGGLYHPSSETENKLTGQSVRKAMTELASEWNDLHPDAKLIFINNPGLGVFNTWMSTQLVLGTGPDCFVTSLDFLNSYAVKGGVVPLNDNLNLANKYAQDTSNTWGYYINDLAYVTRGSRGVLGGLPLDRTVTAVYANRSMLAQAGIDLDTSLNPDTGAPADWATLLDWINRLRALKVVPFSMATSILGRWLQSILADQFFWELTERFNILNYHPVDEAPGQDRQVSQEELVMQITCNGWQPFNEPAVQGLFKFINDFVPYLPKGYQIDSIMNYSYDNFMQSELALLWESSWFAGELTSDTALPFEWTCFWLPPITSDSSAFAHQPPIQPRDIGACVNAVGINTTALNRNISDLCLDWLMFLTTPEHNTHYVNEVPALLPAVRDATILPLFSPLFIGGHKSISDSIHTWPAPVYWFGSGLSVDTFQREMANYLDGETTFESFIDKSNTAIHDSLKQVIEDNAIQYNPQGSWDLTQWPCEPKI